MLAGGATKVLILFAHFTDERDGLRCRDGPVQRHAGGGQLAANGDTIYVDFTTQYAPERQRGAFRHFGGTVIYDRRRLVKTGQFDGLTGRATIVREDASTRPLLCKIVVSGRGSTSTVASYTSITGLTLPTRRS